jgi:hypothetical protein
MIQQCCAICGSLELLVDRRIQGRDFPVVVRHQGARLSTVDLPQDTGFHIFI